MFLVNHQNVYQSPEHYRFKTTQIENLRLDYSMSTRFNTNSYDFLNFKPATFPEHALFMLLLGGDGMSQDEMGM